MAAAEPTNFDYIIAGGGNTGCVVASRLSHAFPKSSIALIEVGPNAHEDPLVKSALTAPLQHGTNLQWNDVTAPQPGAGNRQIYHGGGKMLSGSSAANYGTWVRGHETDFNQWAKIVGDDRWSYQGLLPCFKRTETHFRPPNECDNAEGHGFDGPIHTVEALDYPLGPTLLEALKQAGHKRLADANSGQPLGVGRFTSNWRQESGLYVRQPSGQAYDLSHVHVLTETLVHKILFEKQNGKLKAVGVDLGGGRQLKASKEVIVCCGGLRTPQLLMLSGIGDATHLKSLGIEPVLDMPDVGANFHDHVSIMLFWKLKHPEKALAMGHPDFDPQGMAPGEWLLTGTVLPQPLTKALLQDGIQTPSTHPNLSSPRAHYETTFGYYAAGVDPGILPTDGSIITTGISNFLPTSRGSITLHSSNPTDPPVIDPQYLTTHHDLCILREAMRDLMRIMTTPAAQAEIDSQFQLPGTHADLHSSDDELDHRIRQTCITWFHPGGTAAMGKVVDTECRVIGTDGLRVVDASIFPVPLGAHYQAPVYATAEKAVEMIISSSSGSGDT